MKDLYISPHQRPWYKKKKIIIPLVLLALIVGAGLVIEPLAERELNRRLAETSEVVGGHVEDLDIDYFGPGVELNNVTAKLKGNDRQFLVVEEVEVDLSWRKLLQGQVLAEVFIDSFGLDYQKDLQAAIPKLQAELKKRKKPEEPTPEKEPKEPTVQIARVEVEESSVTLGDYPSLKPDQAPHVANIEAQIINATPDKEEPLSEFSMDALILGSGNLKTGGTLRLKDKPPAWSVDTELTSLDVAAANEFLRNRVPLTFTKGQLDLYAEAKSEEGKIEGYVKPFAHEVDVMRTKEEFKGARHWIIELITAVGNILLTADKAEEVATRLPFSFDGEKFEAQAMEAVGEAIGHSVGKEEVQPGIEDKYDLK